MSDRIPNPEPTCWDCGAPNTPGSSECWLCQRRDWNRYPGHRRRAARERGPLSTIRGWMALIAGIGLVLALFIASPPLGFILSASALPALLVTEFIASRRRRRGEPMNGGQRLAWFIGLTILFPILLVAVGISLFAVCVAFTR